MAWQLTANAQQQKVPARVSFLAGVSNAGDKGPVDCFRNGLRDLGWVEGKNINLEFRWAEGLLERYSRQADELISLNPDLIVASSTPAAQAVARATQKISVVFIGVSDPVASGIVPSLARPNGNVTGVSNFHPATTAKLPELLKAVSPKASRFGVLYNPTNPGKVLEVRALEETGRALGIVVNLLEVRSSNDFERAFSAIMELRCDALITLQEGLTFENRSRIVEYVNKNRLPSIFQIREYVAVGGLMSYGLNLCQHYRRGATYVDKILKGARPAELPVEQPTTFELIVSLKAAKALGLTVPNTLLVSANEVID